MLKAELEKQNQVLRTTLDAVLAAGNPMSNFCYNYAQPSCRFDDKMRPGLKQMQRRWDAAADPAVRLLVEEDKP